MKGKSQSALLETDILLIVYRPGIREIRVPATPPPPFVSLFLNKQPTIFRWQSGEYPLFDTVWPPPPLFEKSWLRPCEEFFLRLTSWKTKSTWVTVSSLSLRPYQMKASRTIHIILLRQDLLKSGCNIYATMSRVWCSPGLYTKPLYMAPLQDVIRSHSLDSMFYADDAQIYIVIDDRKHSVDSVDVLRGRINDVFTWNTKNMLKWNPRKTGILRFTSRFNREATAYETLSLANTPVKVKTKAKNLGVIMDKTLSFTEHINEMCKKASFAIRSIRGGRIRKYFPFDGLKMLENSFVISRLDYCNSLLHDIPKYKELQRIQNPAARMITLTGARSSDHITPILKSLHWLPVEARINFKILLINNKILNGQSAGYLEPLIKE